MRSVFVAKLLLFAVVDFRGAPQFPPVMMRSWFAKLRRTRGR